MGQVSPSCFSEMPMTQRAPHSRLAPTPGPASPRPPAPDTPGPQLWAGPQCAPAPHGEGSSPKLAQGNHPGRSRRQRQGRGKGEEGEQEMPPQALAGSPAGPLIQCRCPGVCLCRGGRGTEPPARPHSSCPGRAGCVIPLLCPSPSALLGRGDRGKEEPRRRDRAPAIPGKQGQPCGEEGRKCGSVSRKPPCPAAASPKAGEGEAAPRPPRRPQRKRLSSPRAPEAA